MTGAILRFPPRPPCLLGAISDALNSRDRHRRQLMAGCADMTTYRAARRDVWSLKQEAAEEFGRLNGWKVSNRAFHPLSIIGQRPRRTAFGDFDQYQYLGIPYLFDHPIWYRGDGTYSRGYAAIVAQPYHHIGACQYRLARHVPPSPKASIHYPGETYFVVFTAPEVTSIRWLPEQLLGLAS
jgi:hypothetical protein